MSTQSRLVKAFEQAPVLPVFPASRYVLFSDCHRGRGNSNDNFLKNQHLYFAALKHYWKQGFTYIELGDGDELWENRCLNQIIEAHSNVYWLLSNFYAAGRLYLLYGNHDMIKKKRSYCEKACKNYFCTSTQCSQPLFPDIQYYSGLILRDCVSQRELYLTHGHQADLWNSTLWKLTRFLVRYLWTPLEHFGFLDPTSAAKNYTRKDKTERRLSHWCEENQKILITGHTHRPRLTDRGIPYYNTGSCVHPRCITCMELQNRALFLVKWTLSTRPDQSLYVSRELLSGPLRLDQIPLPPL